MQLPPLLLTILGGCLFVPLSLCAPPINPGFDTQVRVAPIHVPVCLSQPGGYDLFICAKLLTALRNLPYYQAREIWAEYTRGDGHLPAVFSYSDPSGQRQCSLTMDLYEPGVPVTAHETFSLREEQTDFNNIYFECLRSKGMGGFNRIGFLGNVAALLGPKLGRNSPALRYFKGMAANGTDAKNVRTIDLTTFEPDERASTS
ncbi:MAG: hypothetical protein Q9228_002503 [Teloschistes exilis]